MRTHTVQRVLMTSLCCLTLHRMQCASQTTVFAALELCNPQLPLMAPRHAMKLIRRCLEAGASE